MPGALLDVLDLVEGLGRNHDEEVLKAPRGRGCEQKSLPGGRAGYP
jgi:hypothetical protein